MLADPKMSLRALEVAKGLGRVALDVVEPTLGVMEGVGGCDETDGVVEVDESGGKARDSLLACVFVAVDDICVEVGAGDPLGDPAVTTAE